MDSAAPRLRVVLLNDDGHTYEYVVGMLRELFEYPPEEAFQLARQVDRAGRAVVATLPQAWAEQVKGQIEAYGPDPLLPRYRRSMRVALEPAD